MQKINRKFKGRNYAISPAHPATDLLPWMDDDNLQALVDDMREYGQQSQIVRLPDGRIVLGRHRELACVIVGVEPQYREENWSDEEVVREVYSSDVPRRHLTASQKAMVAVGLTNMRQGEKRENLARKIRKPATLPVSQKDAAEKLGVSERSVRTAAMVKDEAPELAAPVLNGKLDVHTAAKVAKLPKEKRDKVAKSKNPKEAAEKVLDHEPEDTPPPDPSEEFCTLLNAMCRDLDDMARRVGELKDLPFGRFVHWQSAQTQIKNARETLHAGRPTHECPYCKVAGEPQPKCRSCGGLNVVTKSTYKAGVAAVGGGK